MRRTHALIVLIASLLPAAPALSQYDGEYLPSSQVEELDREGQILAGEPAIGKPMVDCRDIEERVPASQLSALEKTASRYLVMPNGDVIDAFRALALREIEDRMRTVTAGARDRLQRDYDELAPQGEITVRYADGRVSYSEFDIDRADEGDTIFEYSNLPPLYELPLRPQPETTGAYVLLGSRLDSPEHQSFKVVQQTDSWLIGYVEQDGRRVSQRLAVHRKGARFAGSELERSCVLWPLSKTAESRREYWDRAPLPLFVPLYFEDLRATPLDLACAAEHDRVTLRNHTASTDRTRTVTRYTEPIKGTALVKRTHENGPWVQKVTWRSTPATLRVMPYDEYVQRRDDKFDREDRQSEPNGEAPEISHVLTMKDGRVFKGRAVPGGDEAEVSFVVVVGRLESPMTFRLAEVERVETVERE